MSAAADADRRTLPPTPKRIQEFRKRGEIALSRDLSAFAAMAGATLFAVAWTMQSGRALTDLFRGTYGGLEMHDLTGAFDQSLRALVAVALPAGAGALVGWLASAAVQLGWPPALAGIKFDPTRSLGFAGLGQILSPKAAAGRTLKSAAKVAFVAIACAMAVIDERRRFLEEPALSPAHLGTHLAGAATRLALRAGLPIGALALLDYFIQRRGVNARMRMTPDEMRREHREQEGDPQIKRRRRRRMREIAKRRLQVAVKTADVVLVNPTEYAVALRYDHAADRAPRVVAKGRGAVAERIRELARQAGVPIIAQPPLTRLIHKLVPEGREIPAQLYHAVAEVLAYVYRLRRRS